MVDLLIGNAFSSPNGAILANSAYYVPKVAGESGTVSEIHTGYYSATGVCNFAVYTDAGVRLWYTMNVNVNDASEIVSVSPTFNCVKSSTYLLYVSAIFINVIPSKTSGTDYDVQTTSDLNQGDTPPADLFSGISWTGSSRYDFYMQAYGTIAPSSGVIIPLIGSGL